LKGGATAFGGNALNRVGIGRVLDELQGDGASRLFFTAEIHVGHAAAGNLAEYAEFSELTIYRNHGRRPIEGFFRKKLYFRIGAPSISAGMTKASAPLSVKMFPMRAGRAGFTTRMPGRRARGARPLRAISLCESQGVAAPEIRMPSPRLSW